MFLAERPGGRLASVRDRHALSASWGLPFAFLLAFTGSFLSFASTIGFPLVAEVAFGGDEQAMVEALYEPPVAEDATPVALASLDDTLAELGGAGRGSAGDAMSMFRISAAPMRGSASGTTRSLAG